jgi:uncharacterized membrane protein YdbT with pleckstrin-like domain
MSNRAGFFNPPFPEKLLFDSEEVVIDLKPHWWHFAKSVAVATLALVGLLWSLSWDRSNIFEDIGNFVMVGAFLLALGWLGVRWLKWRSTHFVVTSDRLVYRSGVFAKSGIAIPLERVNNINFYQSVLERVIRAGDLHIESAGQDGQQLFADIRRPDEVQSLIHAQIEENGRRGTISEVVSRTDIASQLEKLEGLRDRGTLSEAEFEREKRRLLES